MRAITARTRQLRLHRNPSRELRAAVAHISDQIDRTNCWCTHSCRLRRRCRRRRRRRRSSLRTNTLAFGVIWCVGEAQRLNINGGYSEQIAHYTCAHSTRLAGGGSVAGAGFSQTNDKARRRTRASLAVADLQVNVYRK